MKQRNALLLIFLLFAMTGRSSGQWVQVGPDVNLSISSVVENNGILFAGSIEGIFRSKDNARSWYKLDKIPYIISGAATIFSGNGLLFAQSDERRLYCSTDNGDSWNIRDFGLNGQTVNTLINKDGILFIGTTDYNSHKNGALPGSIFRSEDNGVSWQRMDTAVMVHSVFTVVKRGGVLLALTNGGVYRSSIDGSRWKDVTPFPHYVDNTFYAITTFGQYLFISTSKGVFRSNDDGTSWVNLQSGLPPRTILYFFSIGNTLYANASDNLYRTTDDGATWNIYSTVPAGVNIAMVLQMGNGITIGVDANGMLLKSTDIGQTWHPSTMGMSGAFITSLTNNNNWVCAGTGDGVLCLSSDNGDTWSSCYPHGSSLKVAIDNVLFTDTAILVAGQPIRRSIDTGRTWTEDKKIGPTYGNNFCTLDSFIFLGSHETVYRSSDGGNSWTYFYGLYFNNKSILALTSKNNIVFAGTDNAGIYRSTDIGNSWLSVNTPDSAKRVNSIVAIDSFLFVGTHSYDGLVYRSSDFGATWTKLQTPNYLLYSSAITGKTIFAAGPKGLVRSNDLGNSWVSISTGLPDVSVTSVSISNKYLYAGARGRGIWRLPLGEAFLPNRVKTDLSSSSVSVFPNPCSSVSTITLNQPEDEFVQINIIDLLGNKLATLSSGQLKKGEHSFQWNAINAASGMYRLVIQQNGRIENFPIIVNR